MYWDRFYMSLHYNITHSAFGISFVINSDISFKNSVYFSKPKKKKENGLFSNNPF